MPTKYHSQLEKLMRFYTCSNDLGDETTWFLDMPTYLKDGSEIPDVFGLAQNFEPVGEIGVKITRSGEPTHFSTFAFDLPIASIQFVDFLLELCPGDCQLIPVIVDGIEHPLFIVNVIRDVDCVDEENTEYFKRWTDRDQREDKIGDYKDLSGLRIDHSKVPDGVHLFRPKGWLVELIISEVLKQRIEALGAKGISFELVS